jgi:hypothetical protein
MAFKITLTDQTGITLASGQPYIEHYVLSQGLADYDTAYTFARGAAKAYGYQMRRDEVYASEPWGLAGLNVVGYDCFKENHPRHVICLGEPYEATLSRQIRIEQE